jgi:transcription initiation factor IIE alpha subunit
MKIIRRKRTITIKTCEFREWQSKGMDERFSCPNCGKTFENAELNAAIEKLRHELVDDTVTIRGLLEVKASDSSCEQRCSEKPEGKNNHE